MTDDPAEKIRERNLKTEGWIPTCAVCGKTPENVGWCDQCGSWRSCWANTARGEVAPMDIVEKVATEIADIPGDPSSLEIARVAIEAYQNALWPPIFDTTNRFMPNLRRHRAQQLTAHIMHVVGKYLCDHGAAKGSRDASRELMEALYDSGADIITDADRATAGLPARGPCGLTEEELNILEVKRIEMMLRPISSMTIPAR